MPAGKDSVRIAALGGFGEIGMNCLTLEADGRLLIVDCGVMFPPRDVLGVDVIHPSFDYLVSRQSDIVGLVLTHGHEDHVAGVPFLLREVDLRICGGAYTLGLLSNRMEEFDSRRRIDSRLLEPGVPATLGPFQIESFPMPHSIIDNYGLRIDTPAGRILHTGDFRLGVRGPDQGRQTLEMLSTLGQDVDLMISDSTGAEEDEAAGEEDAVARVLTDLVRGAAGRVYIAIFASNVRRLEQILDVARRCDRRVALCGRSVHAHARVAARIGAIDLPADLIVPVEELGDLPRNSTLAVVSGTQGERRSALGRLASDAHRNLQIERGDLVVLSSRFIPGNEIAISSMIDRLLRLGAQVIHRGNNPGVHVSGHGSRHEIRAAVEAVKPRGFLPAHGTYRHLVAAAEMAREIGVPRVAVARDGQVVRMTKKAVATEEVDVPVRRIYVDGGAGLPDNAIRDRTLLGSRGVLFVSWVAGDDGLPRGEASVIARGVVADEAFPWFEEQVRGEVRRLLADIKDEDRRDPSRCGELVRSALRKFSIKSLNREPFVFVSVLAAASNDEVIGS
jgi:ribonuclease J